MKLSVELEMWRADRPDEWKMDEFIRNAEKLESERNALAEQVEALHSHRHDLLDLIYNCAIGQVSMGYAVDAESLAQSAYSITGIDATSNRKLTEPESPQQHLRDVRAEAVIVAANSCLFMADINTDDGVVKREICLFEDLEQFAELAKAGEV